MKTALGLLAVATFLVAPSRSATQSAIFTGIQASADELSPEVQRFISRGDELTGRMRFDAAAHAYARAADVARREGHLPSGTTWKVATAHYLNGDPGAGATALDRLTDEAARVGDLEVQALSMYYAAWLDAKAGHKAEVAARVARLEGLLRSPYMPVALRDQLSDWIKTSKEIAVK